MRYRFATERQDYSDLSGGHVFYSRPGFPAFPVRLASELFQRAYALLPPTEDAISVFDPCCGSGYLLAVIGILHQSRLKRLFGNDIDPDAVALAKRNLALLTPAGLATRHSELITLHQQYEKPSHAAALQAALRLQERIEDVPLPHHVTSVDASNAAALNSILADQPPDIVICDVPYGQQSAWQGDAARQSDAPPVDALLAALHPQLPSHSIVAVAANKTQKLRHPLYQRLGRESAGKRQLAWLKPI